MQSIRETVERHVKVEEGTIPITRRLGWVQMTALPVSDGGIGESSRGSVTERVDVAEIAVVAATCLQAHHPMGLSIGLVRMAGHVAAAKVAMVDLWRGGVATLAPAAGGKTGCP